MDDDDDADLYGDLLPFNRGNDVDFKKLEQDNANLRQENDKLKQKINGILLENRALAQDKKKLETNFSSLIKTAQTEMKRKDQIIAELRRDKDSVVFRRGRNTRNDNRSQERNHPDPQHERYQPEPRQQIERLEPVRQSRERAVAGKQLDQPAVAAPHRENQNIAVPCSNAEAVVPVEARAAEIIPTVAAPATKISEVPQTVFSKRLSSSIVPISQVKVPEVMLSEVSQSQRKVVEIKPSEVKSVEAKPFQVKPVEVKSVEVMLAELKPSPVKTVEVQMKPSGINTPEMKPEVKKKRITPVLISEPPPKVAKTIPKELDLNKDICKVTDVNCAPKVSDTECLTPKNAKIEESRIVTNPESINIPKSKVTTHIKSTFDTSNSKTTDFKRRVSTNPSDVNRKRELSAKSPLKRHPSFVSETSCDGVRRPSNYDLMKRNVRHKYAGQDSPKKSDRSGRSRSRPGRSRDDRARDGRRCRVESERNVGSSSSRRREGNSSRRHDSPRRLSKADASRRSPAQDASPRRDETPLKRRASPTFGKVQNFSPMLTSTARKNSEMGSSRDRSVLESQAPSASKSRVKPDDVLEKSSGELSSSDSLDRREVETMETSTSKVADPKISIRNDKASDAVTKVASVPRVSVASPLKTAETKRKSIEAVADSLTIKLTTQASETATNKTVEAFTAIAALKTVTAANETQLRTHLEIVGSSTAIRTTDVASVSRETAAPIPSKDFFSARILADFKTPTASAENSTEISQSKTMSPPDVPRAKAGHAPTSFSGIKLGDVVKHFTYPFTPMKMAIADEYMSFPSMITPLKATPVKADYVVEEDSLDLVMKSQLAKNKDQLGRDDGVRLEATANCVDRDSDANVRPLETKVGVGSVRDGVEKTKESETVNGEHKVTTESVSVNSETSAVTRSEVEEKKDLDLEEGEISDEDVADAPKEPEKPIVSFFKKSKTAATKESKSRRTRIVDEKKVVSSNKMMDLRQRLVARNECQAPPRNVTDYEIRLKSPYKVDPRVSSVGMSSRASRTELHGERMSYDDNPAKSGLSRSLDMSRTHVRGRSPTARFLEKSPERSEPRKSNPKYRSPEKQRSEYRSKSPKPRAGQDCRRNISLRLSPQRRNCSSGSRSPKPRDNRKPKQDLLPFSACRKSPARNSGSASHSRSRSPKNRDVQSSGSHRRNPVSNSHSSSRSPKPRAAKQSSHTHRQSPRRCPSGGRSRSKSPPSRAAHKREGRASHSHVSPTKRSGRCSRSRSKSLTRDARNGPAKVSEWLLQSIDTNGSSEDLKSRRKVRTDGDVDFEHESSTRRDPKRRSRSKSRSRSLSPIIRVAHVGGRTASLSQDSPKKTPGMPARAESSQVPAKTDENSAAGTSGDFPARRRRPAYFKTGTSDHVSPVKVNERMELIDRILDSDSGISSKNISPVSQKIRVSVVTASEEVKASDTCVYLTPIVANLPDILSTLGSNQSPVKSKPAAGAGPPFEARSLGDIVSTLVQTANPELQKCLDAIQTSFGIAAAKGREAVAGNVSQATECSPAASGFPFHRRSAARVIPNRTSANVSEPTTDSEVTPVKPDRLAILARTPTEKLADEVATENKSAKTSNASPATNSLPATSSLPTSNGFPFRRRRAGRIIPQGTPSSTPNTSPDPTPTKVPEPVASIGATMPSAVTPAKRDRPESLAESPTTPLVDAVATGNRAAANSSAKPVPSSSEGAAANGFPFRRRGRIRMIPSGATPTPRAAVPVSAVAQSSRSDVGMKSTEVTPAKSTSDSPILESALLSVSTRSSNKSLDLSVSPIGAQSFQGNVPLGDRKRKLDASDASEGSGRKGKRRKESGTSFASVSSDGKSEKRVNKKKTPKKVGKVRAELPRAKSLFGSDTEEEECVSESPKTEDSHDGRKSAESHRRRDACAEQTSIWPERPADIKRRTTVFLEDLPKSSEKMIQDLLNRASRNMSEKKTRRWPTKKNNTLQSKAPISAEFVATDDSDDDSD